MRKPRRLAPDALQPFVWELPERLRGRWGDRTKADATEGEPEAPAAKIDWVTLYGNDHPVEIEVGFGKGLFLVNEGVANPDRNYFGIEIIRKYQLYAATRVANRGLPNVKTCCADAKIVMREFVVPGTVSTVHVFFPDPWWKNKHKKRLLFTPEFATLTNDVLKMGGQLHFVTDVQDYFEMVTETLRHCPGFEELPQPPETAPVHDMDYLTNFERKFRKEGRPIYRSRYVKVVPTIPVRN